MIYIDRPCSKCKHIRPNRDGWIVNCDAFPDEIPDDFFDSVDPSELKECNNGIKYEPREVAKVNGKTTRELSDIEIE